MGMSAISPHHWSFSGVFIRSLAGALEVHQDGPRWTRPARRDHL